ncbi:hypothetical protein C8J57DRAFT_1351745 [Mycena rebaudengoi]|nr:hypothetical protein C8J57DRAFT_1351745 [Mycena rebaudengoi]
MTPLLYPTLLSLALFSQFQPSVLAILPAQQRPCVDCGVQLHQRQEVNATCAPFCTPEILALNNIDHKANKTTCTEAIGKQFAECTQCLNGYVTLPYGNFVEDCQKLGVPVKDASTSDGKVPGFNPSAPSGAESGLAHLPQCAWLVALVVSTGVLGLFYF